jgi:hypothetical protein
LLFHICYVLAEYREAKPFNAIRTTNQYTVVHRIDERSEGFLDYGMEYITTVSSIFFSPFVGFNL